MLQSLHIVHLWVSVKSHRLQEDVFVMTVEQGSDYGYNSVSLRVILLPCSFSTVVVVVLVIYSLVPVTYLVSGS